MCETCVFISEGYTIFSSDCKFKTIQGLLQVVTFLVHSRIELSLSPNTYTCVKTRSEPVPFIIIKSVIIGNSLTDACTYLGILPFCAAISADF